VENDDIEPRQNVLARLVGLVNPFPAAMIGWDNPVFERQVRLLRWPRASRLSNRQLIVDAKLAGLKRYTVTFGCLIPLLLVIALSILVNRNSNAFYVFTSLLPFAAFAGLGFSVLCNIYYVVAAINTILPQMSTAQWEPLRLTLLTEEDILSANHATIQMRVWRAVLLEIATRLILILSPLLGAIIYLLHTEGGAALNWSGVAPYLALAILLLVGFVLEPLWRMRTVTLIGMTVAAWARSYGTALLVAFGAVLLLLCLQLVAIIGVSIFIIRAGAALTSRYDAYDQNRILLFAFFAEGLMILSVFFFFKLSQFVVFTRLKLLAFRG